MPEASSRSPTSEALLPSISLAKAGSTCRWAMPNPPKTQVITRTVESIGVSRITDTPFPDMAQQRLPVRLGASECPAHHGEEEDTDPVASSIQDQHHAHAPLVDQHPGK